MTEDAPDIAGYTIERLLGAGGMAKVYLAIQKSFERRVALKVISRQLASDPEFGRRFLREARIVGGLSHPHIVQVYDVGDCQGVLYLAMELFTGGDLRDRMRSPLSARRALEITRQLATALGFAHQKGFVHRDIKPDNVLFRESGEAVLTDFGIARPAHGEGDLTEITVVESVIGSPRYMSPEQSMGDSLDKRSDIYSLGIMLYEMLTGSVPFTGRTSAELSLQRKENQSPRLPDGMEYLQPLLDGMLAYNRDDRFADCGKVQVAIDQLLTQRIADTQPQTLGSDDTTLIEATQSATNSGKNLRTGAPGRTFSFRYPVVLLLVICAATGLAWLTLYEGGSPAPADTPAAQLAGANGTAHPVATRMETPNRNSPGQPAALETPPPEQFFEFYDAVNTGLVELEEAFIKEHPESVFADILRVKLAGGSELFRAAKQMADGGDTRAQLVISELYATGWGVQQNKSRALDYARDAAAEGSPFAAYHYATLLLAAAESDAERREGLRALEQAADGGFYLAQTVLANYLFEGRLLGRDVDEGLRLLEAAGNQGDRNALFNLARILDSGLYLEQADPVKARGYFERAAQLGKIEARDYLNVP